MTEEIKQKGLAEKRLDSYESRRIELIHAWKIAHK